MGHLGLTAQSIHNIGGFKAQGKDKAAAEKLKKDALALEASGCFSLVLECIPAELAKEITGSGAVIEDKKGSGPKNQYDTKKAVDFFNRHCNTVGLRRGVDGVRDYVKELLAKI